MSSNRVFSAAQPTVCAVPSPSDRIVCSWPNQLVQCQKTILCHVLLYVNTAAPLACIDQLPKNCSAFCTELKCKCCVALDRPLLPSSK